MIVPVIEHMESEMNSITTTTTTNTARLLNSSDDKTTSLKINETNSDLEKSSLEKNENVSSSSVLSQLSYNDSQISHENSTDDRNSKRIKKDSWNSEETTSDTDANNNNVKIHNGKSKEEKIDLNQQTIIIEGGVSTLQFQLKPEIIPNRQITLKLVPVGSGSTNESNLVTDTTQILKSSTNLERIQQNMILNDSNNENDLKELTNNKLNSSSVQTVKLGEANQNVYFMMQPIDLLPNTVQSNSVKIKSPQHNVSSTTQSLNNSNHLSTITLQNIANPNAFSPSSMSSNTTTVTLTSPVSSTTSISPTPKVVRDERRRANHNEVERRRRDNINKWIVELSKVIPDCCNDQSKHGQSKGGILEKTVQYLLDMKSQNQILSDQLRSFENLKTENDFLRQQLEDVKKENQVLKMKLENSDRQFS